MTPKLYSIYMEFEYWKAVHAQRVLNESDYYLLSEAQGEMDSKSRDFYKEMQASQGRSEGGK